MGGRRFLVSVVGGHKCGADVYDMAREVGAVIADSGAVLVCGGLGGIMEAAARGAKENGGMTLGIIPGDDKAAANEYIDLVISTGMGYSRNTLVAGTADIVIAMPGEYGTLSEIAFALNGNKPVFSFSSWEIKGVKRISSFEELRSIIKKYISQGE